MSKILVVDDDWMSRELLKEILSLRRFDVLCAGTGAEAVSVAQVARIDLVFLDIQLPDMPGWEVFKQLRNVAGYEQVPVIAVTASLMKDDEPGIPAAGFAGLLRKPVVPRAVRDVLARHFLIESD